MQKTKDQKQLNRVVNAIVRDKQTRTATAYLDHSLFFSIYFSSYIKYPSAPFHHEMFSITENDDIDMAVITSFRSSAKSTIFGTSYPLWSIVGRQKKKFIILFGQTQTKAQQYLRNIKTELETNELLKQDLGPFEEENGQWGAQAIYIPKFKAKIMIASVDQSIRGIRHNQYRPDLFIIDDVEDLNSTRTKEGRDKTWEWLTGDVIPAKGENTKIIVVGNLLHEDCLLMRLKAKIAEDKIRGIYREYAIVDQDGQPTWPGRFPDEISIENERLSLMDDVSWYREYMLKIIAKEDQAIKPEWIKYYDTLAPESEYEGTIIGIDLAISQSPNADYTAMVVARVYGHSQEDRKVYIMPHPVNERLSFQETLDRAKLLADTKGLGEKAELLIEDVAYQRVTVETLINAGYDAKGVKIHGTNKLARLRGVSHWLQSEKVLFPKEGAEDLINQLVNFGVEKNDDLVDAFTILLKQIIDENNRPKFIMGYGRPDAI